MRYSFIVNPASGQGNYESDIIKKIDRLKEESDKDIRRYYTQGEMDAAVLADMLAKEAFPEDITVFACGGDGTIQEVANGLFGNDNAILGIYPCGSGNDFVRALGGAADAGERFLDLERQLEGRDRRMDILKMTYDVSGEEKRRYVVNGINIGFDGNTAILAHELKKLPAVSGTMSYILAIAVNFIKKKGENLTIRVDGRELHKGPLLLATVANGGFCGGGFESCPLADLYDGEAEVLVIKDIPRRRFPKLIPQYMKGKVFDISDIERISAYSRAKTIEIEPSSGFMRFVADGEIFETGSIKLELISQGIRVLIP